MKILRKILVFILGLVLSGLIGGLLLSFAIKNVIQEELVGGFVKENFVPLITESNEFSKEEQEALKTILEDKEVEKLINDVVDEFFITVTGDGEISQETIDAIFDYMIDNKDRIESITGQEIDTSQLEEIRDSEEYKSMTKELSEAISETTSELDDATMGVIKTYTYIVSNKFRIILLIGIILDLLLIALVQWSLYNWLTILGKVLIASGVTLIVLCLGMNLMVDLIAKEVGSTVNISITLVLIMGIISIITGIALVVVHKFIKKKVNNQELEYAVS